MEIVRASSTIGVFVFVAPNGERMPTTSIFSTAFASAFSAVASRLSIAKPAPLSSS